MTLEEAIKRYTSNAEFERTHGNLQGCLDFLQLAEWLKELKQLREQTEWIPVNERLPEIHNYMQEYIVTIKGNFVRTAFFTETNGKSWWSIDDVIAWMPLSKPYKAESEES